MTSYVKTAILPLIDVIFGIVEVLLLLRVLLKFFGANPSAPFTNWIYATSTPLLTPFLGMFPSPVLEGRYILEFSTLFALIIYGLIAYLISELILAVARTGQPTNIIEI
jgi:hypothetical protein